MLNTHHSPTRAVSAGSSNSLSHLACDITIKNINVIVLNIIVI